MLETNSHEASEHPLTLFERGEQLIPEGQNIVWAEVSGIPARDGHPGLGFKGNPAFVEHGVSGTIVLQQDPAVEAGLVLTLIASPGETLGRPVSRKSLPEITHSDVSQRFDALQVRIIKGERSYRMHGFRGQKGEEVRGLYGSPDSTTAPDAELFFWSGLKALEHGLQNPKRHSMAGAR